MRKAVAKAFYPIVGFQAGTVATERALELGRAKRSSAQATSTVDTTAVLARAAESGWAYVELPEQFTVRTDAEVVGTLAELCRSSCVVA